MNSNFRCFLGMLLIAACLIGLLPAAAITANAATTTYQLTDLLEQNKIKPLGRTQSNLAGTALLADWPGSGFQMNVSGNGGELKVNTNVNYYSNWAVLVDDEQVFWKRMTTGGVITANIPAGNHTVTVIKESDPSNVTTAYCELTTMSFSGTIDQPPADKDFLVEFVGASYTCGHGTLGQYYPAVKWDGNDHSFMHAYPWYATQKLDADYTIAARGGIGLFAGTSVMHEDGTENLYTMYDIYQQAAAFRLSEGLYDFENRRQPDAIVFYLGANDGTSTATKLAEWKVKMEEFTDMVREKNPDAAIIYVFHRAEKTRLMMQIVDERAASDPNLYCFAYTQEANGVAARTDQEFGHPNAQDSKELGEALADFMIERGIISQEVEEPTYSDINYYVAASGSDSNAGNKADAAKLTLSGAMAQARADYPSGLPNGSRLVFNLTGTVNFNPTSTPFLGNVGALNTQDGKNVPILVTTNNYNGTKAVLNTGHKPADSNDWKVYFCHSMTLKDITFQSTTNQINSTTAIRDYLLYAGYNQIVYDNVTFSQTGVKPTAHNYGWIISAGHVNGSVAIPTVKTTSSVTFKNGDYTNLLRVTCTQTDSLSGNITSAPNVHCEVHIQDGAKMGTVYNRFGRMSYGSCTFYMEGGSINQYNGTKEFTSTSKGTYQGDVNFVMTGGDVFGKYFYGSGSYASVTGNINNTISGGVIKLRPTADWESLCFGARGNCTIGGVNNTISGGNFFIIGQSSSKATLSAGIYFGGRDNVTVTGDVVNKISDGSFLPLDGDGCAATIRFNFGATSGWIKGELRNEITGGTFDTAGCTASGYRFGMANPNSPISKTVNIIGEKDTGRGPMLMDSVVYLGGSNSCVGATEVPTAMPSVSDCSDNVVVSNTIYGGYFASSVYCAPTAKYDATNGYYNLVNGSVENNIYNGYFVGDFFAAGGTSVYGKVTTNIYGGCFSQIYGAGSSAMIYDGVELNIYDLEEYYGIKANNGWEIWAGAYNTDIPAPQTSGRDAVKLTIAPKNSTDLTLNTPIKVKCATGSILGPVSVSVTGGVYPQGFSADGVTLEEAIEPGYIFVDTQTGNPLTFSENATTTGTTSVSIVRDPNAKVVNKTTGVTYATLDAALADAENTGATVSLGMDVQQNSVTVWDGITLDLNGHTIESRYFTCYGDVVDGAAGGEALLDVDRMHIWGENSYLPLYDTEDGGYRLYKHELKALGSKASGADGVKFAFRLKLANPEGYKVLADTRADDLDMRIMIGWGGVPALLDYGFSDATLQAYAAQVVADYAAEGTSETALTITVKGLSKLKAGDAVTMQPILNTASGVQSVGDETLSWKIPAAG